LVVIIKRNEGQWVEFAHLSGNVIKFRVGEIEPGGETDTVILEVEADWSKFRELRPGKERHKTLVDREKRHRRNDD
jgi:hypothetical protein